MTTKYLILTRRKTKGVVSVPQKPIKWEGTKYAEWLKSITPFYLVEEITGTEFLALTNS